MVDAAEPDPHWFRHQVLTRAAASVWWIVMILFPLAVIDSWARWATRTPTLAGGAFGLVFTVVIMFPLVREAPNARRMGRMLIRGT